jgi:hypothetical protein
MSLLRLCHCLRFSLSVSRWLTITKWYCVCGLSFVGNCGWCEAPSERSHDLPWCIICSSILHSQLHFIKFLLHPQHHSWHNQFWRICVDGCAEARQDVFCIYRATTWESAKIHWPRSFLLSCRGTLVIFSLFLTQAFHWLNEDTIGSYVPWVIANIMPSFLVASRNETELQDAGFSSIVHPNFWADYNVLLYTHLQIVVVEIFLSSERYSRHPLLGADEVNGQWWQLVTAIQDGDSFILFEWPSQGYSCTCSCHACSGLDATNKTFFEIPYMFLWSFSLQPHW